ncbi:MAG: N-acetyltransferase [Dokdonella sp.]|nr:MAG: N-acetyltransferase [Gammaproteobacteria bacterium]TXI72991.1 MAG: N-acetyltransferase [Dokdonella sp.]
MTRTSELKTDRLLLRRARSNDLDAIHQIMRDGETMRFWSTPPHASKAQTRRWLDSMLSADPSASDEFVIEHDGIIIGKLGAWCLPEIGFFLRRESRGQGLAYEALTAFIEYIRSQGVAQLTADVDPLNIACLKLLTRAGFLETGRAQGTYVVGERVCDSVYFRLNLQSP